MKFIANDTREWEQKEDDEDPVKSYYLTYNNSFDSFKDALEAAKRAAYHSKEKQDVQLVVAEVNPIVERLETDFAIDPDKFNIEA